jgi:hypothetical protein
MFADDSKCFRSIRNSQDSNLLQSDINLLCNWSSTWDLKFNYKKCSIIRFSRKRSIQQPEYHLNNELIPFKSTQRTQRDLGIQVSSDLKWSQHIRNVVAKANRMLGFYSSQLCPSNRCKFPIVNIQSLDFDVDRPRTWKSLCTKCRSFDITCCS